MSGACPAPTQSADKAGTWIEENRGLLVLIIISCTFLTFGLGVFISCLLSRYWRNQEAKEKQTNTDRETTYSVSNSSNESRSKTGIHIKGRFSNGSFSKSCSMESRDLPRRGSSRTLSMLSLHHTLDVEFKNAPIINWVKHEDPLGSGGFSDVYHGIDTDTHKSFAVKQVYFDKGMLSDQALQLMQDMEFESALLRNLEHKNIITLFGRSHTHNEICLFLELMPCGTVTHCINAFQTLPEILVHNFALDILNALSFIHLLNVIHRDVKCSNFLIDATGVCKLSDFGSAVNCDEVSEMNRVKGIHGTPNWMAPEMISEQSCDCKVDIWSFGCSLIEMCSGDRPWHEMTEHHGLQLMFYIASSDAIPKIPNHLSTELINLMKQCLIRNSEQRSTAEQLLNADFFHKTFTEKERISNIQFKHWCANRVQQSRINHEKILMRQNAKYRKQSGFISGTFRKKSAALLKTIQTKHKSNIPTLPTHSNIPQTDLSFLI